MFDTLPGKVARIAVIGALGLGTIVPPMTTANAAPAVGSAVCPNSSLLTPVGFFFGSTSPGLKGTGAFDLTCAQGVVTVDPNNATKVQIAYSCEAVMQEVAVSTGVGCLVLDSNGAIHVAAQPNQFLPGLVSVISEPILTNLDGNLDYRVCVRGYWDDTNGFQTTVPPITTGIPCTPNLALVPSLTPGQPGPTG